MSFHTHKKRLIISTIVVTCVYSMGVFLYPMYRAQAFIDAFDASPINGQRTILERYIDSVKPERMLTLLEERYPLCHGQAHDLGKVIFAKNQDLTASVETCATGCTGGCFHGVLMEAFGDVLTKERSAVEEHITLENLKHIVKETCKNRAVGEHFRAGNCAHGVGHAFVFLSDYNLSEALPLCELFESKHSRYYCAGGAFMEYDMKNGKKDRFTKPLHFPCDISPQYTAACYPYKIDHLVIQLGSRDNVVTECLKLPSHARHGCFLGIGFNALYDIAEDPSLIRQVCSHGDADDQYACIEGAIAKLSDFDKERAEKACKELEDTHQQRCYEAISHGMYSDARPLDPYVPSQ